MNQNTITKWNSIWYAELFTLDGRLQTKVKFRVPQGSTQAETERSGHMASAR